MGRLKVANYLNKHYPMIVKSDIKLDSGVVLNCSNYRVTNGVNSRVIESTGRLSGYWSQLAM